MEPIWGLSHRVTLAKSLKHMRLNFSPMLIIGLNL